MHSDNGGDATAVCGVVGYLQLPDRKATEISGTIDGVKMDQAVRATTGIKNA